MDPDGVALAVIQGLNQKLQEQRAKSKQKETEITRMRRSLEELKKTVGKLNCNQN